MVMETVVSLSDWPPHLSSNESFHALICHHFICAPPAHYTPLNISPKHDERLTLGGPAAFIRTASHFVVARVLFVKTEEPVSLVHRADRICRAGISIVGAYRSILVFCFKSQSCVLRFDIGINVVGH
jgi:hypothetical protein